MTSNPNGLDKELLLVGIDRTYQWKLCRMVMLLRILKWRKSLLPAILGPELQDTDDNLVRDGLMLDITQTCWEIAEALGAVGNRLLKKETSVVKALVEYQTKEAREFFDKSSTVEDANLARLFEPRLNAAELQEARRQLSIVAKFMESNYPAAMKAKHGGVTLIGWAALELGEAPKGGEEQITFVSIVDYDKAKVVLKPSSLGELDTAGKAVWWLYDHMVLHRVPRGGVRIKGHPVRSKLTT